MTVLTPQEREILDALDRAVHSPKVLNEIEAVVRRVNDRLNANTDNMAWETIPLEWFGSAIPSVIRSAWVFILRAGVNTGAERHPNSHQRMMSFAGTGSMDIRDSTPSDWRRQVLVSDTAELLERRWISIPPNVWHQPETPAGPNWVVVSFHTVPTEELIEERPAAEGGRANRQMHYVT